MNQKRPFALPDDLASILSRLRSQIRRYVLLEGIAVVVAVLGGIFWFSFGLDHAWFAVSRLELPVWFRATFDVLVIGLIAFLVTTWIGLRLFRSFRTKALALVLERRFPQLDDRLVTAVEFAETAQDPGSELSHALLQRTIDDAVRATRQLNLDEVFNPQPLRRAFIFAVVLIVSIGGLGIINQQALATWKASFISLDAKYWQREVGLTVKVLAQPGDLVREFKQQSYKHARGADLTLLIEVDEHKQAPERVQLRYRFADGRGTGTVLCSRVGERQFRHSIPGVLDNIEFWIYGGDFVNPTPYRVQIVDPPRLDRIELQSRYPEYTGMNSTDSSASPTGRVPVAVRGTQVSIPLETDFRLEAVSNKPLRRIRLQMANQEVELDAATDNNFRYRLIDRPEDPQQQPKITEYSVASSGEAPLLDATRTHVSLPFLLSNLQTDATKARRDELQQQLNLAAGGTVMPLLVLKPDTQIRIFLEDSDEILTAEPARVMVNGVVDQTPVVETKLRGIGTSITRKASIPILGRVSDDYGIADVRFEFQVNDAADWTARPLEVALDPAKNLVREFKLQRNKDEELERFEVVPLDLSLNQKLVVTLVATDRDHLNGPHLTRGERYTFKVVTNEELLSQLYQRELNLRRRFEQIISESKETQQDLIRHRARVDERARLNGQPEDNDSKQKLTTLSNAIVACAERSLHAVRKSANENAALELSFRDIREELVNNGLHTPQTLERLDDRIVKPLHAINEKDYPAVDEALGLYRLANNKGQDPTPAIDASVQSLGLLIANMERILGEMRKLETFQEALEQLKAIIEQQEQLTDKVKKQQKRELLKDALKD